MWAFSDNYPGLACILLDGFAEALQGLHPGGHRRIAVPTQTFFFDDAQNDRWPPLRNSMNTRSQLQRQYLEGLYVKVWITQLQVPTDDSRHIQYDFDPLSDGAVHTHEVLCRAMLPGTFVCSQGGCGSCMAAIRTCLPHHSREGAFKCEHVADKARELAQCSFCNETGCSSIACAVLL